MSFSFLSSPLSSRFPFSKASSHALSSSEVSSSSLFFFGFFKPEEKQRDGGDGGPVGKFVVFFLDSKYYKSTMIFTSYVSSWTKLYWQLSILVVFSSPVASFKSVRQKGTNLNLHFRLRHLLLASWKKIATMWFVAYIACPMFQQSFSTKLRLAPPGKKQQSTKIPSGFIT